MPVASRKAGQAGEVSLEEASSALAQDRPSRRRGRSSKEEVVEEGRASKIMNTLERERLSLSIA